MPSCSRSAALPGPGSAATEAGSRRWRGGRGGGAAGARQHGAERAWSEPFRQRFAGQPLKAARWSLGGLPRAPRRLSPRTGWRAGRSTRCRRRRRETACTQSSPSISSPTERGALAAKLAAARRVARDAARQGGAVAARGRADARGRRVPADAAALAARAKSCPVRAAGRRHRPGDLQRGRRALVALDERLC